MQKSKPTESLIEEVISVIRRLLDVITKAESWMSEEMSESFCVDEFVKQAVYKARKQVATIEQLIMWESSRGNTEEGATVNVLCSSPASMATETNSVPNGTIITHTTSLMGDASTRKDEEDKNLETSPTIIPIKGDGDDPDAAPIPTTPYPTYAEVQDTPDVVRLASAQDTSEVSAVDEVAIATKISGAFATVPFHKRLDAIMDIVRPYLHQPKPVSISLEKCGQAIEKLLSDCQPIHMYSEDEIAKAVLNSAKEQGAVFQYVED